MQWKVTQDFLYRFEHRLPFHSQFCLQMLQGMLYPAPHMKLADLVFQLQGISNLFILGGLEQNSPHIHSGDQKPFPLLQFHLVFAILRQTGMTTDQCSPKSGGDDELGSPYPSN